MYKARLFIIVFIFSAFMSGCIFNRRPSEIRIPVPDGNAVIPVKESLGKASDSVDSAKESVDKAVEMSKGHMDVKPVKEMAELAEKASGDLGAAKGHIAKGMVSSEVLEERLADAKKAFEMEYERKVSNLNESFAVELKKRDEKIAEQAETIKEKDKIIEEEKGKREETEKILSSTVSRSWSYLSWLGLLFLVGGSIGAGVMKYLGMGYKAIGSLAGLGLIFMIAASTLPRVIVTATTAMTWILYALGGSAVFLIVFSVIMMVLHGRLRDGLIDLVDGDDDDEKEKPVENTEENPVSEPENG